MGCAVNVFALTHAAISLLSAALLLFFAMLFRQGGSIIKAVLQLCPVRGFKKFSYIIKTHRNFDSVSIFINFISHLKGQVCL